MWVIVLVIVLAILIFFIATYNALVTLRQKVKNSYGQMDVQLQRRFDLIQNLISSVKGYMTHESDVLEKVTNLRTSWSTAKSLEEKASIDNSLSDSLKTIMAVSENYPDLKASEQFLKLQEELSDTEDKISYSRQFYNDIVTKYNTKLEVFPSSIVASMFHFTKDSLFEVSNSEARNNVTVDFNK